MILICGILLGVFFGFFIGAWLMRLRIIEALSWSLPPETAHAVLMAFERGDA